MKMKLKLLLMSLTTTLLLIGCASEGASLLHPYADTGMEELGERSTRALTQGSGTADEDKIARQMLSGVGTSRKALPPSPNRPVVLPAEIRLMWIPDHLNKYGDLVPAHYYYLRVMDERFNLEDAFSTEGQLDPYNNSRGSKSGGGATPWVYKTTN